MDTVTSVSGPTAGYKSRKVVCFFSIHRSINKSVTIFEVEKECVSNSTYNLFPEETKCYLKSEEQLEKNLC